MADSKMVVNRLYQVDPQFVELVDTLFGGAVDPTDIWGWMYRDTGSMPVSKMSPSPSDVATRSGNFVRRYAPLVGASVAGGVIANQLPQNQKDSRRIGRKKFTLTHGGKTYKYDSKVARNSDALMMYADADYKRSLRKADDSSVTWDVEFSKVDDERMQVFGWASIVEVGGKPVIDRQGDWIDPVEIEKAAYAYVEKSRKGGNQHKRADDGEPFHASDMIESIVFTDEKVSKMGLPDDFPRGWWVGYQVRDRETWDDIKAGRKTGFSIHGKGRRREVAV